MMMGGTFDLFVDFGLGGLSSGGLSQFLHISLAGESFFRFLDLAFCSTEAAAATHQAAICRFGRCRLRIRALHVPHAPPRAACGKAGRPLPGKQPPPHASWTIEKVWKRGQQMGSADSRELARRGSTPTPHTSESEAAGRRKLRGRRLRGEAGRGSFCYHAKLRSLPIPPFPILEKHQHLSTAELLTKAAVKKVSLRASKLTKAARPRPAHRSKVIHNSCRLSI
jgi:hypothetical protein